jgi:hypothetical protein
MQSLILTCPTLKEELEYALKEAGNTTPIYYLDARLHDSPPALKRTLQTMIDSFSGLDQIIVLPSRCGGGTAGLKASTAKLILPKTRDCLDILLSGSSLKDDKRDIGGVYLSAGWMDRWKNSDLDLDRLTKKYGEQEARTKLMKMFMNFNHFYIIDTGVGDIKALKDYITPLVKITDGTLTVVKGGFGILKKVAKNDWDDDFQVVPKGGTVNGDDFLSNGF